MNTEHQPHALIIDRQPQWREFASKSLRSAGYAADATNEYQLPARMDNYDFVLLGCDTVGPDEAEIIAQVKRSNIPIFVLLVMTYASSAIRTAFLLGARDVAKKPFSPDALDKSVREFRQLLASDSGRRSNLSSATKSIPFRRR